MRQMQCQCGNKQLMIFQKEDGGKLLFCPEDISGASTVRIFLLTHPKEDGNIKFGVQVTTV